MLLAPEATPPVPGCSELLPPPPQLPLLLLLQPGEEEDAGARGGVAVVMMGQTEGLGESMGGVGGLVRGVRGPEVRRGPFNCGSGCGSSVKKQKRRGKYRAECQIQCRERITAVILQSLKAQNQTSPPFFYYSMVWGSLKTSCEEKFSAASSRTANRSQLGSLVCCADQTNRHETPCRPNFSLFPTVQGFNWSNWVPCNLCTKRLCTRKTRLV